MKAVGAVQEAVGVSIGPNYSSIVHIAGIDLEKTSLALRRYARGRKACFAGIHG